MSYEIRGVDLYHFGKKLHLLGVNVSGMELPEAMIYGVGWADLSLSEFVQKIKDAGFNAVRLPITSNTIKNVAVRSDLIGGKNPKLIGLRSLEICDELIDELEAKGIRYLFDLHYLENGIPALWYTSNYPEVQWLSDLETLARRYTGDGFIGIDIKNEPNSSKATWGDNNQKTDFRLATEKAAKVILSANPDVIVMTEAMNTNPGLDLLVGNPPNVDPAKLSYSIHLYGPDVWKDFGAGFRDPRFPKNMPAEWDKIAGNAAKRKNVIIGEWGGNYGRGWGKEKDKAWQEEFATWVTDRNISTFYWMWTHDSHDTGGMLEADRKTIRQDKLAMIQRMRTPFTTFLGEEYEEEVIEDVEDIPTPTYEPNGGPNLDLSALNTVADSLQDISRGFKALAEALQDFIDTNSDD